MAWWTDGLVTPSNQTNTNQEPLGHQASRPPRPPKTTLLIFIFLFMVWWLGGLMAMCHQATKPKTKHITLSHQASRPPKLPPTTRPPRPPGQQATNRQATKAPSHRTQKQKRRMRTPMELIYQTTKASFVVLVLYETCCACCV